MVTGLLLFSFVLGGFGWLEEVRAADAEESSKSVDGHGPTNVKDVEVLEDHHGIERKENRFKRRDEYQLV